MSGSWDSFPVAKTTAEVFLQLIHCWEDQFNSMTCWSSGSDLDQADDPMPDIWEKKGILGNITIGQPHLCSKNGVPNSSEAQG